MAEANIPETSLAESDDIDNPVHAAQSRDLTHGTDLEKNQQQSQCSGPKGKAF